MGIEAAMGWSSVGFVFTGSSVPGFSQNPLKGKHHLPTKITSTTKSDVDISIKADGVERFITECTEKDVKFRGYPTTCSKTTGAMRYGFKDLASVCAEVVDFHKEWAEKLAGGLQLTFSEDSNDIPPWEARIPIAEVKKAAAAEKTAA